MTGKDLFREIGNINEEYIKEAQEYKRPKRDIIFVINNPTFRKMTATAACLMICAGLAFTVHKMDLRTDSAKESANIKIILVMPPSATISKTISDEVKPH